MALRIVGAPQEACTGVEPKAAVRRVVWLDAWKNVIQSSKEDQEGMGSKLSWAGKKEGDDSTQFFCAKLWVKNILIVILIREN